MMLDAFLIDIDHLTEAVRAFLPWVGSSEQNNEKPKGSREFKVIAENISEGARVLDLGCGDGELLSVLRDAKNITGLGFDLDLSNVVDVINKGHNVFQGDLDEGLTSLPDGSYDYAILSSTLQQVRKPRFVLKEIVRVAREGIVTFPNFAYWRNRVALGFKGRMPTSEALPYEWYDTPNIHLTTRKDFIELCRKEGIEITDMFCIPGGTVLDGLLSSLRCCNLAGAWIIAWIRKKDQ
jgi:methionine biosynthesis protein MetW